MRVQENGADLLQPRSLDAKSTHEWHQLAGQVLQGRARPSCSTVNVTLQAAAEREPQSPAAPAYRLWMADNLVRDGLYPEALAAYDSSVDCAQSAARLVDGADAVLAALYHKAQAAALARMPDPAMAAYRALAALDPGNADPLFQAGLLAEAWNDPAEAAALYRAVAGKPSDRTDDPAELARRALLRLDTAPSAFAPDAGAVADSLSSALERRDLDHLRQSVSRTHFAVGPVGGHTRFEGESILDELYRDLKESTVATRRTLLGSGDKLYLPTSGWQGRWFRGDVVFMITRASRGWQWTGLAIAAPNELWMERWRPAVKQTNQPLPFGLLAPWPAGECFKAGGLYQYIGEQLAVVAAGLIGGSILAIALASGRCGWGPRGFYYNQGSTHDEEDAFAIDFTRYRRYVPYDNESGGTPVLAARAGIVVTARAGTATGSSTDSNTVEIEHADPANPADMSRFRSRYLHLEGPFKIPVSVLMPVVAGTRLGRMDDTGNSVLDHLHFSIHDRQIPHPNAFYGGSVRPTPMSGVQLEDGDSGTCVCSNNVEYAGEKPMIQVSSYAGQNWLITPAATAVNQAPPQGIRDQAFLLVLSGVAVIDLKGNSGAQWRHETVSITPDLNGPLTYAIGKYGIPTPPGTSGSNYWTGFQVEQWAPFAALSSVFNKDHSVNSGFAVDVWRPNPFATTRDPVTNAPIDKVFAGIQVDVAVRDTDAWIHRLSYHITLLGKIIFGPIIIS